MIISKFPQTQISSILSRTPNFKGKTRIIRIINRILLSKSKPFVNCRFKDGTLFKVDLRSRMEAVPAYLGCYEPEKIKFVIRLLGTGWVALDVGAHIGFFTIPMAKALGDKGKLYAFEALPTNFERLKANLKLNHVDGIVTPIQVALSDTQSVLKLGMFEDFVHGAETGNAVPLSKGHGKPVKEINVQAETFDSLRSRLKLERLDFIKIDIEGHEDAFFRGAKNTIDEFRPVILGEFNEDHMGFKGVDVDDFIRSFFFSRDYLAYKVGEHISEIKSLKGRANTDDILLIHKEKANLIQAF